MNATDGITKTERVIWHSLKMTSDFLFTAVCKVLVTVVYKHDCNKLNSSYDFTRFSQNALRSSVAIDAIVCSFGNCIFVIRKRTV